MYLIVAVQCAVLLAMVALHELNRAFDSGPGVELEISQAYAQRNPFRGAAIHGRPALNLDGTDAAMPPDPLVPGDRVFVIFEPDKDKRPRIRAVERRGQRPDPPFDAGSFSIPGRVLRTNRPLASSADGAEFIARVGKPPVQVELDLPASIRIDDATLQHVSDPSIVRASLRRGALGYRYYADVWVSGEAWGPQTSFTFDSRRDQLVVFSPAHQRLDGRPLTANPPARTSVYFFDGAGRELRSMDVPGRVIEGIVNPADGTFLALVSQEAWGYGPVQLTQIGEDGAVLQRGPQIVHERVLGFDTEVGGLWVLAGPPTTSPQAPYSVERMTLAGSRGSQLGPFPSRPRAALSLGNAVWVLEPDRNRVMRLDRAGRIEREYGELNRPTDLAVDAESIVVIEASQTQLSKLSLQGRVLWRVPRFEGLAWILPDTDTGAGWVGALSFEGQPGGVFRYSPTGEISRLPGTVAIRSMADGSRSRLATEAIRDSEHGRFYVRESSAIVVLGPDGTVLRRVDGFRYPGVRPLGG
jgi:hypothetical protein